MRHARRSSRRLDAGPRTPTIPRTIVSSPSKLWGIPFHPSHARLHLARRLGRLPPPDPSAASASDRSTCSPAGCVSGTRRPRRSAGGGSPSHAREGHAGDRLLVLFAVVRRRWNTVLALFAVVATAFPPVYWRTSDDFLTEPPTRIFFLLAFACAIALSRCAGRMASTRHGPRSCCSGSGSWRPHLKVQWYVGALMLLPALVFDTSRGNLISKRTLALGAAALTGALSVMAVNWIGWRTMTLSPGFGLHANLRYEGTCCASIPRSWQPRRRGRRSPTLSGRGCAGGTSTSGPR